MAKGKEVKTEKKVRKANFGKGPRLYVKAQFAGFRRSKSWVPTNQAILKIEDLNDSKNAHYYLGKRVVYVYKTKHGFRTMWGRVTSAHGNNGVVKAKFLTNLPPRAIGATFRVMLYPNRKTK